MSALADEPIPLGPPGPDHMKEPLSESGDIYEAKRRLRGKIRRAVAAMPPEARAEASRRICGTISGLDEYRSAHQILFYHALPDEADLGPLIDETMGCGRDVLLPVTDLAGRRLRIASLADPVRDLKPGAFGILEPREGLPLATPRHVDLILVPGRAFDPKGGRVGRGKGFYDGFLGGLRPRKSGGPFKLGVGFACQLVDSVPMLPRDVRMDAVVTEDGVIRRGRH